MAKKPLLIGVAACVAAAGVGWAVLPVLDRDGGAAAAAPETLAPSQPTTQDISRGTPQVTEEPLTTLSELPVATEEASGPPTSGAGRGSVSVATTYHGWDAAARAVVIGGFVGGVVESGGTCTLSLTRGDVSLQTQSPAEPDATTTTCGELVLADGALTAGTWQAVLSYASEGNAGASVPVTIEVP